MPTIGITNPTLRSTHPDGTQYYSDTNDSGSNQATLQRWTVPTGVGANGARVIAVTIKVFNWATTHNPAGEATLLGITRNGVSRTPFAVARTYYCYEGYSTAATAYAASFNLSDLKPLLVYPGDFIDIYTPPTDDNASPTGDCTVSIELDPL